MRQPYYLHVVFASDFLEIAAAFALANLFRNSSKINLSACSLPFLLKRRLGFIPRPQFNLSAKTMTKQLSANEVGARQFVGLVETGADQLHSHTNESTLLRHPVRFQL